MALSTILGGHRRTASILFSMSCLSFGLAACDAVVGLALPPRSIAGTFTTAQPPSAAMAAATAALAGNGYHVTTATPTLVAGNKGLLGQGDGARQTGAQIIVEPISMPLPVTPPAAPPAPARANTARRTTQPAAPAVPPAPPPPSSRLNVSITIPSGAAVAGGNDRALLDDLAGQLRQRLPDLAEQTP